MATALQKSVVQRQGPKCNYSRVLYHRQSGTCRGFSSCRPDHHHHHHHHQDDDDDDDDNQHKHVDDNVDDENHDGNDGDDDNNCDLMMIMKKMVDPLNPIQQ